MKSILFALFFCFCAHVSLAENIYDYQTYNESKEGKSKNPQPLDTFSIVIGDLEGDKRIVKWSKKEGKEVNEESYVLDQDWSTVQWEVVDSKESLKYSAVREGNKLRLKGISRNKNFEKEFVIDDDPFYYNPKVGLRFLVGSDKESMTFWGMRHDNLDIYKMKAVKKGKETIQVNGQAVEAIRIDWSALQGLTKYFSRTYWFRSSDGNFVKQKVAGSKVRSLVSEH
ncbi:MAG: hypothetical protein KBD53_08925 [Candidatus Omnitrophica bacterium]|nr:hypothetical protein [Candidatus Omnitrophota bacterium]